LFPSARGFEYSFWVFLMHTLDAIFILSFLNAHTRKWTNTEIFGGAQVGFLSRNGPQMMEKAEDPVGLMSWTRLVMWFTWQCRAHYIIFICFDEIWRPFLRPGHSREVAI
jgi:hypothetical protein